MQEGLIGNNQGEMLFSRVLVDSSCDLRSFSYDLRSLSAGGTHR